MRALSRVAARLVGPVLACTAVAVPLSSPTAAHAAPDVRPSARAVASWLPAFSPSPEASPAKAGPVGSLCTALGGLGLVGQLLAPAQTLICQLSRLEYQFHTVYVAPDGRRIERTHAATIGLRKQLNVDHRPGADLVGTISVTAGFAGVALEVVRVAGDTAPLGVSVEAIYPDPTGATGASTIAFGYDQLGDTAPAAFRADLDLDKLTSSDGGTLDVGLTRGAETGVPDAAELNVVASAFDGSARDRETKLGARLTYLQPPQQAQLLVEMGDPMTVRLQTSRPGTVIGAFERVSDGRRVAADLTIDDLPHDFAVTVDQAQPRMRYLGTAANGDPSRIDHVQLRVTSDTPLFSRATRMRASVDGLSSGTELAFDTETGEFALEATDPIDLVEVFAGSEDERLGDLPAANGQGARFVDRPGQPFVIGARVRGLQHLRATAAEQITLDASSAGGPFSIDAVLADLEARASIRDLPREFQLAVDPAATSLTYSGSSTVDRLEVGVESATPMFLDADEIALLLRDIPREASLDVDLSAGSAAFRADAPLGVVEVMAKSPDAVDSSDLLDVDDSGAVVRIGPDETFVFGRLHALRELEVATEPMAITAALEPGHPLVLDAVMDDGTDVPLTAELRVDALPANLSLAVDDQGGAIHYRASGPVGLLSLAMSGIEVLSGADRALAEVNRVPTAVDVQFAADGSSAEIVANEAVDQVRVAAGGPDVVLPDQTLDNPEVDDLLHFDSNAEQSTAALRLTAVRSMSVTLDPMELSLRQEAGRTRPVALEGSTLQENGQALTMSARLDRPGFRTSMTVDAAPDRPTRLIFDNSAPIDLFELSAEGLTGIDSFVAAFEDVSRRLSICMDAGGGCRRSNPNVLSGGGASEGRPYPAQVSMDFEDFDTHGEGVSFRPTVMNAQITLPTGRTVIEDLRFANLGLDFGQTGTFSGPCTFTSDVPRAYLFADSRNRPFMIGSIKYPPAVKEFRLGTASDMARADNRIAWLKGCDGLQLDRREAGSLDCGGARELVTGALGGRNLLDLPLIGQGISLCGG